MCYEMHEDVVMKQTTHTDCILLINLSKKYFIKKKEILEKRDKLWRWSKLTKKKIHPSMHYKA